MKITILTSWTFATLLFAGAAQASDKPEISPSPAWVHPAETPKIGAITDGMPLKVVLSDQQARLQVDGIATYQESILRVQTAQGLPAVGTLSFAWDPTLDRLIIHKLHIIRDGQVIDVLAKQSFTVLRRENNLEAAALDGVLTAAIQPEDLRVGDAIDMAVTRVHKDPSLGGHNELYLSAPDVPVDDLRIHVTADTGLAFRWRTTAALREVTPKTSGEGSDVSIALRDMQPLHSPEHAPARFANMRRLEISGFKSWADLSSVMAPLYDKAEVLKADSPLRAEAARIKAASPDPKVRAAKVLTLVQDQIRYLALSMNDGGLVPATADETWSRRFGDCKGKTVLLIALLREMGIDAQPALISSQFGDGLDERLPAVENFDHVLVRATIAGQVYWLDGTRSGDVSLDEITTPPFFWALPVQLARAELVRLVQTPFDKPQTLSILNLDATAGLDAPAPAHAERTFHGDAAVVLNAGLANLAPTQMDEALKAYWGDAYDFIKVKAAQAHFDPQAREEHLTMDGVATMHWYTAPSNSAVRQYETDGSILGWKPDFDRTEGFGADAPFAVTFPMFDESHETIFLPQNGTGFTLDGGDIDVKAAGYRFTRKSTIAKGVVSVATTTQSLAPEFPASETDAATKALRGMGENVLYVRSPSDYKTTTNELQSLRQSTPDTADEYITRGAVLAANGDEKGAREDFQKAAELDSSSVYAQADLALTEIALNHLEAAKTALTKAVGLNPNEPLVVKTQATLASAEGHQAEALAFYDRAIQLDPNDIESFKKRITINIAQRKFDRVLADIDTLINIDSNKTAYFNSRAYYLLILNRKEEALAQSDLAMASMPDDVYTHLTRGRILMELNRTTEAATELDRAQTIQPTFQGYLYRANLNRQKNPQAARQDLDAAERLVPKDPDIYRTRAAIDINQHDDENTVVDYTRVLDLAPEDVSALTSRGKAYARLHKVDLATADFAAVRVKGTSDAQVMNELCWAEGTANLALDLALKDCAQALALKPENASYLDSQALVLLRLERYQDAIASYDVALQKKPGLASSLYGRGLAKQRVGEDGSADLEAARKANPQIEQTYDNMGLKSTATPAAGQDQASAQ